MKNVTRVGYIGFGLASLLILATEAQAKPRPPLPPIPERCLLSLRFNDTNWWGDLRPAPLGFDNVQLVESWSGYALYAGSKRSSRLQYPIVTLDEKTGRTRTNLDLTVGSLRFWFQPEWTSASLGGSGPGVLGRLVEVGAWTKDASYGWWSLAFSEDGDTVFFSGQAGGQEGDHLNAPIQFQAGVWHLITLTYGPKFSEIYLDGELAAQGAGVTLWPKADSFSIANSAAADGPAGGTFEEWTSFGFQLSAEEIAHYYRTTRPIADLGPISEAEEQARLAWLDTLREAAAASKQATILEGGESMMSLLGYGTNDYGTNLWLEVRAETNLLFVVLHNTARCLDYQLLQATNGPGPPWELERLINGLDGQTEVTLTNQQWPSLFLQAVASGHEPAVGLSATNLTYIMGSGAQLLDPAATVNYAPPLTGTNRLTITIATNAQAEDLLAVRDQGTGSGQIGKTNLNVTYSGTVIGTWTNGAGSTPLTINLYSNATSEAVAALLRNITYEYATTNPVFSDRRVEFSLADGCGTTNGTTPKTLHLLCPEAIDAMLVFDKSQSLSPSDFQTAKQAASNFVNHLDLPVDRVGLVSFAGYADLDHTLTHTGSVVQATLLSLATATGTVFHPAFDLARSNLTETATNVLRLMLLFSDGRVGNSNGTSTAEERATNTLLALAAAENVKEAGIRLFTIAYGTNEAGTNLMKQFANSPQDYSYAPSAAEFAARFSAVAQMLCRRPSNAPPSVSITSPTNQSRFVAPTNLTVVASATDPDGTITEVEFFAGGQSIGEATQSPCTRIWTNAPLGTNQLWAVATDNHRLAVTSAPVTIVVLARPTVSLTSPTNGEHLRTITPAVLAATASDPDGIVTKVEFFAGQTKIAEDTNAPYSCTWTNAPAGTNELRAVATDNDGLTNTSAVVTVTVAAALPPTISITSPPNAAEWVLFSPLPVKTHALDSDGIVTNVAFYIGTNFQAAVTNPPFHWNWSNAYQYGTYQIRAQATDNDGLSATSIVSVTVTGCTTISIQTVSLAPTNPFGEIISTGIVILHYPAETGGRVVRLAVSNILVRVPPSLYFPPGQRTNQFLIETSPVTVTPTVPIYSWVEQSPFFRKTNYLTLLPREGAVVRPPPYCGKMDVAFVVDTTQSMDSGPFALGKLDSFRTNVNSIVDHIEAASGGDYRLALVNFDGQQIGNNCGDFVKVQVLFEARNRTNFCQSVSNLSRIYGCDPPEASDEAIKTVIYGLSEDASRTNRYGDPLQYGSFSTPFRTDARKLIILITDAKPGGADGSFSFGTDDVQALQLAQAAWERGIQICSVGVSVEGDLVAMNIMQEYARVSYGIYHTGYRTNLSCYMDGTNLVCIEDPVWSQDDAFKAIFSECGNSFGKMIVTRDEATAGEYPTFIASDTNKLTRSALPVVFDTTGLTGRVSAVRLNRMGDLHREFTGSFDFELGVSSASDTNLQSFGAVWINSLLTSAIPYEVEWQLAREFNQDVQPLLGKAIQLFPTDRVSGSCGTHYALYDTPAGQWPAVKNTLTLLVERPPDIPAGRCAGLKLTEGDPPQICPWDIVVEDRVIASAARPNGWSLEEDHTPFEGVNLCVPAGAVIGPDYRVRSTGAQGPRSARFNVIVETSPTVPVLLPMVVTPSVVASNGDAEVAVSLDAPAPAQGAYVSLTGHGQTNLLFPAWVYVGPGGQAATFTLSGVTSNAMLRASYNGLREASVSVLASGGSSLQSPSITNISPEPGRVLLSWSAVSYATSYNVERALGSSTNFVTLYAGVTCTEITDFEVPSATNYCYRVRAVNAQTSSVPSATSCTNASNFVALTAPYIVPWGGTFYESVQVTLTNQPTGSLILYTLDASLPTASGDSPGNPSTQTNTGSFVLTANTTLRALSSLNPARSGLVSADFIILHRTALSCSGTITSTLTRTSSLATARSGCYADQYVVSNAVGKQVTLAMTATNFDTYLVFRETNGTVLAQSDDTIGAGSRVDYTLPHTGDFIVEATTSQPGQVGAYTLSLKCADVPELEVLHADQLLPNHSTLDFGFSTVGSNTNKTLVITNSGTTNLVLGPMTISPPGQFSVSPTQLTNIPPNGSNSVVVTFLSLTNGLQTAELRFTSNDGDNGDGIESPFVLNLWAWGNRTGTPPAVAITSPVSNQNFSVPISLTLTATSTPATNVLFFADGQFIGERHAQYWPPPQPPSNTVFSIAWTNWRGGTSILQALAIDDTNRATLSARVPIINNWSPFAVDDDVKFTQGTSNNVVKARQNDWDVEGSPLTIVTNTQPTNGSVINRGTNLLYTPPTNFYGRTSFTYTTADTDGGSATATVHVGLRPQGAINPPQVSILWPTNGQEVTSSITLTGSVSSDALDYWRLAYRGHGSGSGYKVLAEGLNNITYGPLAVFDPTLLLNGTYDLELTAVDLTQAAEQVTVATTIAVKGNLKIGQFTLAFTDLQIPVSGLPLTVTRRYDSRDQGSHDFGVGWSLDMSTVRLEQSQPLGAGWEGTNQSGHTFCLADPKPHLLSVTFPDGRLEQFRVVADFYGRGSCIGVWGPSWHYVTLKVDPLPGTTGGLALMGPTDIVVSLAEQGGANGPVTLHDFSGDPDHVFGPLYHPTGFVYTNLDGRRFEFDGQGTLLKMTDHNANSLTFTPDGAIHSSGRSVKFVRDPNQRITAIYDPNGLDALNNPAGPPALKYKYDANGNLTHVHRLTDRSNTANPVILTTTFLYGHVQFPHYITEIQDPRGVPAIRNEYDNEGRLTATTDAEGRTTSYIHKLDSRQEIIVDRLGYANRYTYDVNGNVTQKVNALGKAHFYTYDANNNRTSATDPLGHTTLYQYDEASNLLLSVTNPLQQVVRFTYNSIGLQLTTVDARGYGVTNGYDAAGNLLAVTNALGAVTRYEYEANGNLRLEQDALTNKTFNGYDEFGRLTAVTNRNAAGQTLRITTNAYDGNGNLTASATYWTGPSGIAQWVMTSYRYDAQNRLFQTIYPDNSSNTVVCNETGQQSLVIDQLGRTNRYEYSDRGELVRITYADGTSEGYAYDAEGRRTFVTNRANRITQHLYDPLGRLTRTVFPDQTSSRTIYDSAGRVACTVDARGTTNAFGYDDAGRRVAVTNGWGADATNILLCGWDASGNLTSVTNGLGQVTEYVFDALNRQVQAIFPTTEAGGSLATNQVGFDLIGRRLAETNEAGIVTRLDYDGLGRLIGVTNAWGNADATWAIYAYDQLGNQTNQVDALGRVTRFSYDLLGRRVKRTLPGGQWEGFAYDAVGNLLRHTNFNGLVLTNAYDSMNRLLKKATIAGTVLVTNAYLANGLRTEMWDESGRQIWVYDGRDRVRTNSTPAGALYYEYDVNGNLTKLWSSTSNGVSVAYQYDALSRLTAVMGSPPGSPSIAQYQFDQVSNLRSCAYSNTVTHTYAYDARQRLTNLVVATASGNNTYRYTLSVTGQRTQVRETLLDGLTRLIDYRYDAVQRLTNETASQDDLWSQTGTVSYTYDRVSNRSQRSGSGNLTNTVLPAAYGYTTNDWLTNMVYDAAGNTRTNATAAYEYDWANRLTNAVIGTTNIQIWYDGNGHRVRKKIIVGTTTNTTPYLVDERNPTGYAQVLEELSVTSGATNLSRVYAYGLGLISQRLADATVSHYVYDGHGTVVMLTDSAGYLSDLYVYDAFGTMLDGSSAMTPNHYLYAGEEYDPDLRLYYLRARYMHPDTGRFWTMDTFEGAQTDPLSLHKYFYAQNDPVDNVDPSGHEIEGLLAVMDIGSILAAATAPATVNGKAAVAAAIALPQLPTTKDAQLLAGLIFAESSTKLKGGEDEDEKIEMGLTVLNRTYYSTKNAPSGRNYNRAFGNGTVLGALSVPGEFVAYGGDRWKLVMNGDSLKSKAELEKLQILEKDHLRLSIDAAEFCTDGRGSIPYALAGIGDPPGQSPIAFNRGNTPPNSDRMFKFARIASHSFYAFRRGRETE